MRELRRATYTVYTLHYHFVFTTKYRRPVLLGDVGRVANIANRAMAAGVAIQVLSFFAVTDKKRSGVILGYGGVPTTRIEEGLRRLRECFSAPDAFRVGARTAPRIDKSAVPT